MADFLSLTRNCGKAPIKGTKTKLYMIPFAEISAFPQTRAAIKVAGGTETPVQGDTKILDEAYGLITETGKGYFREVDILVNTGDVNNSLTGEVGGQENEVVSRFFILGNGPKEREFVDVMMQHNGCLHMAMPSKDGQMQAIGEPDNPVFVRSYDGGTGGGSGAERVGYAYEVFTSEPTTNKSINVDDYPLNLTPAA